MSRYDGLIIPRSYSEYINKTDAATLQQALQLSGVLSGAVAAGDNKAVKSSAVNNALADFTISDFNFNPTKFIADDKIGSKRFNSSFNPNNKPTPENLFYGTLFHNTTGQYFLVGYDYLGNIFERRYLTKSGSWKNITEVATKTDLKTYIKKNEYTDWTSGAEKSVITPDVNRPQILMLCGNSGLGDVQTYALGIRTVNSNAFENHKNYITWIKAPPSNIVFTLNVTDITKIKIDYTGNYSLHLYLWT